MFSFKNNNIFQGSPKRLKNYFLGSNLELFSTENGFSNRKISHFPDLNEIAEVSFSASKNNQSSIWVGYIERSEFIEIPLNVLNRHARNHEWVEVRILRGLLALGHRISGLDLIVELKDHGIFQSRFMEAFTFLKAINESLGLNIQQAKLFEIVDSAVSTNFGKRKIDVHGVFSIHCSNSNETKGKGVFHFGKHSPLLPVSFFARKGFIKLWNHGIAKHDLEDLNNWPRHYWEEFLSPLEQASLGYFVELEQAGVSIPDRLIRRKRRKGSLKLSFAA